LGGLRLPCRKLIASRFHALATGKNREKTGKKPGTDGTFPLNLATLE